MILFPAVDIKNGQCVRLKQGLENEVTVFSPDPVAMALHWESQGARWLHLVDLDGAFRGKPVNQDLIREICGKVNIPVQLGGGIRDLDTARVYINSGVSRLIIGTMALEDMSLFADLCLEYPGRIGVSLDARNGRLKSRGWVEDTGLMLEDAVPLLENMGSSFFVYTDIARDGMESGINIRSLERMLALTSSPVIAAGGVAKLEDVQQVFPFFGQGLEGAITGRAIYSGSLDFKAAVEWLSSQEQ